jgi:hypothetical protein
MFPGFMVGLKFFEGSKGKSPCDKSAPTYRIFRFCGRDFGQVAMRGRFVE